jgi:ribosomal protein S18 acetylase RimI-like enzyme
MTAHSVEIRSARQDEMPQTVACIVAAFITDPIGRFAWPSPHQYLEGMAETARAFGGASFEHGTADVTADFCGAGLWLPPGIHPNGEALEQVFRDTAKPEHLDDLLATFEKMDEWHPEEKHWYLPLVGVEPNAQGRGLGGALMRHATARADADGVLAYLESSNPRNISLYERHGFEVMGKIQIGAGPLVTPMLRRPR